MAYAFVRATRFSQTMTVTGPTGNTATVTGLDFTGVDCAVVIFQWPENKFPSLTALSAGVAGAYVAQTGTNFPTSTNFAGGIGIIYNPTGTELTFTATSSDSGNGPFIGTVLMYSGANTGQATPTAATATGTDTGTTQSALSVSSGTGSFVVAGHMLISGDVSFACTGVTGWTQRLAPATASGGIADCVGDATGAATVNTVADWDDGAGGTEWLAMGISLEEAGAAGPTIDTQPVADTGLINGDPTRRTTVYVCEASTADGGGILSMTWEEDGIPVADGGIYDIVESGIGTASATSTLTITRTVKTGTPFSMQCLPTDANGETPSDAVQDTWYTGPTLSKSSGITNASGVDTLTITSDYPNAVGEFTVVTATAGSVSKTVSLHYEVP